MPRLTTLRSGAAIYMYAGDHAPPHVHVRGAGGDAQVRLADLQIERGIIARRDYVEALAWIEANRDRLDREWRRLHG